MRVLVACEESGTVCEQLLLLGHDAWSCDLEKSRKNVPHLQCDVRDVLDRGWDGMIAHPVCTYLAVSRNRWQAGCEAQIAAALEFVFLLRDAPIEKIAIEQPKSRLSSLWRKPDQIIHPWQFGHMENKMSCLWLKNLPKLQPTKIVPAAFDFCHRDSPSGNRARRRSETLGGIAKAMSYQWFGETNGNT